MTCLVVFLVLQLLAGDEATIAGAEYMMAGAVDPVTPIFMDEHVRKDKAYARATAEAEKTAVRKATVSVTKDHSTASATAEAEGHAEARAEGSATAEAFAEEHKKKKAKHEARAKAEKLAAEKASAVAMSNAEKEALEKAGDVATKLAEEKARHAATKEALRRAQELNLQNSTAGQTVFVAFVLGLCFGSLLLWGLVEAKGRIIAAQDANAREPADQETPYMALSVT
mmetsp:Transcript_10319/g.18385  ORF Transcript_10319/g.18385 Transcript_10319/m.18385 type:complete len:227 (+) Transcript_10319:52-732(+)